MSRIIKEEQIEELRINGRLVKMTRKVKLYIEGENFPMFF